MSKVEELALKEYPVVMTTLIPADDEHPLIEQDCNKFIRKAYIKGYHQAEKDLELTWEDIREIYCTTLNLKEHLGASVFGEPLYQEVLKRFKNLKKGKNWKSKNNS